MAPRRFTQGTAKYRNYLTGAWGLGFLVLIVFPFLKLPPVFGNSTGQLQNLARVLAFAVAMLGLNLLVGFAGSISLGHSAFMGIGAYATIITVGAHNWSFFAALPFAFVLCFIVGCVIGLPALRIKGLYLVVVTIALALVFPTLVIRFESLTGGSNGKGTKRGTIMPPKWTPFDPEDRIDPLRYRYFVLLIVAGVMFLIARNIIKSRAGRALIAQRDNPTAAAVSGVPVPINKVLVFGLSAGFAGVAGWMLMISQPFASEVTFGAGLGVLLIIGLVAGGVGTISGAIPGAIIIVIGNYLLEQLTEAKKLGPISMHWLQTRQGKGGVVQVVFGLLLLGFVFILPGGFIDGVRRARAKFVQLVPHPRWLEQIGTSSRTPDRAVADLVPMATPAGPNPSP